MIQRQLTLPVARQELWEALTEPDRVGAWFGALVEWELRPGGTARFRDRDGSRRAGVVEKVTAGEFLRFRWWPDGIDRIDEPERREPESEVTYTLEEVPDGTRLTVTERPAGGSPSASLLASQPQADGWDLRLIGLWLQAIDRVPALV